MKTVNIHEAKTHLSRLVEEAAAGRSFIIAKAGKPMVEVRSLKAGSFARRLGFLEGQFDVPDHFNSMYEKQIDDLFRGRGEDR